MRSLRTLSAALIVMCALSPRVDARDARSHGLDAQVQSAPPSRLDLDHALPGAAAPLRAAALNETTMLGSWTFDSASGCVDQGWTSVDITAQVGDFFHVDDFAGLGSGDFGRLVALEGAQSMWCGARPDTSDAILCGYAALPGYGNGWDQAFTTAQCVPVTGDVTVDYLIAWDSEPWYDSTTLQWDACDDQWHDLYGGLGVYDGNGSEFGSHVLPDSLHPGQIRLRFHFTSDLAWSDQDNFWPTDGAVILDSLTVSDATGVVLPTETFEGEAVGDHTTLSGNWTSAPEPGYGDFASLYPGFTLVQEDPCRDNISCLWAFINGSTYDYSCGGWPAQKVVPYENSRGQYIFNEIWSPPIPVTGQGDVFALSFDVYRDLPLNPLIFYVWHVRSYVGGCPGLWKDRNFVFYSPDRTWYTQVERIGDLVAPGASDIQVGLGVIDQCKFWCGTFGTGQCHSHSPLFDDVSVYRVNEVGGQWSVRDIDLFQDNFAEDGTVTGTVRADAAQDLMPSSSPAIDPGDSAVVSVTGGGGSLATDPHTGAGPAVYCYVSVWPQGQPGKSGAVLSGSTARWPVVDSLSYGGDTWYCIRMDTTYLYDSYSGTYSVVADKYCVDLADSLFTPGDTVGFFFSAQTAAPTSVVNYYTRATGATETLSEAVTNAMEFTCLPAGGPARGGDILYVDGMDGRGAQPFFDTAFDVLGIRDKVDRYDVRGPSSGVGNRPAGRVASVFQQLIPIYKVILWDTGNLSITLSDGSLYSWSGAKTDDWGMLAAWMDNLPGDGGVYLTGDNLAEVWAGQSGPGAIAFRSYLQHNLVNASARYAGYGISPLAIGEPGGMFDHVAGPDTLIAFGGCPVIKNFDVLEPIGSAAAEMSYGGVYDMGSPNAAVVAQHTTNAAGYTVGAVLSGFGFESIRDDRPAAGSPDRVEHLKDILAWLGQIPNEVLGAGDTPAVSSLRQNYPNPFNPQTTIAFTVAQRGPVTLTVYNVAGQRVRRLVNDVRAPGVPYRVTWDGRNEAGQRVSSGVYFYKLVAKGFTDTKKMVVLK